MMLNRKVIVLQKLNLTELPRVKVPHAHNILKIPNISVDLARNFIQVVPLDLKCKNYHFQLQVISEVVALMKINVPQHITHKRS